jgi:hypothetical protein
MHRVSLCLLFVLATTAIAIQPSEALAANTKGFNDDYLENARLRELRQEDCCKAV